jgi:M3 family oligoendopeptidase
MSMPMKIPEYTSASIEVAEIPSLTMELFTSGWMELFFKGDAGKYRFMHLSKSIDMILAVTLGDEFQHFVYDNPGITPAERRKKWLSLNSEYFPDTNYEDINILNEGGSWLHVPHLFQSPFYFIDYALAQFCAYQLWQRFRTNRSAALDDYFNLCRAGGSKSFNESLALANLKSPFETGLVQTLTADIEKWLDENNP